jgi:hypothetical protein
MGLNLGPSYGAGGYADALKDIIAQQEMARRTAIMEQESQQRGAQDQRVAQQQQIQNELLARQVEMQDAQGQSGRPMADYGMNEIEGPQGGPAQFSAVPPQFNAVTGKTEQPLEASNRIAARPVRGVPSLGIQPTKFRPVSQEQQSAAKLKSALDELRSKVFTVGEKQSVVSPEFGVIYQGQQGETPEQKDARELEQFKKQRDYAAANPIGGGPVVQIQTVDEEGKPVIRVMRRGEAAGQDFSMAPPAALRQQIAGAKRSRPVLDSISELSEKINTQKGVIAKMSGGVERAKAEVNLNDDVAEYLSLVSMFTPILARGVGHVGVLTQQDVDSVRKGLPAPGDSKSLRDRKIARVEKIMASLSGEEAAVPPEVEAALKSAPNGKHTLSDGSSWIKDASGIRKGE